METKKEKTLLEKIVDYMQKQGKTEIPLKKIYATFKDEKKSTIRGRINEAVKLKKHIIRTGKGQYLLLGAEIEALVETKDTKTALFDILKSNIYYDLVFLDIPYKTGGQKGGNRNLSNYNMIEPEEFQVILKQIEKMLKNENSQLYFMIAGGKSSLPMAKRYIRAFDETSLRLAAEGSYTKLNKNGTQCNMGKYIMPAEKILVYSADGELLKPEDTILDFRLVRPPLPRQGGYPTQKPLELLTQIIEQGSNPGDRIFDPFTGSGQSLLASLKVGNRKFHGIEINDKAVDDYIIPKMKIYGEYYDILQAERAKYPGSDLLGYIDEVKKDLSRLAQKGELNLFDYSAVTEKYKKPDSSAPQQFLKSDDKNEGKDIYTYPKISV